MTTRTRFQRMNAWIGDRVARKRLQPLWVRAHHLALLGLNVGRGSSIETSGERWVIDRFVPSLQHGDERPITVLDVGAHRGEFGTAVAQRLGGSARIVFVEPFPDHAARLRTLSASMPNTTVVEIGLSDAEEELELYAESEGSALASVYDRKLEHFGITVRPIGKARFTTLDALLPTLGIDRVHLLKLDVEGHELAVLRGARASMASDRIDAIQFEFGGSNIDSRTFLRDFWEELSPRYRLHRIVLDGLAELPAYDERDEMFTTTNLMAVRRDLLLPR